MLELNELLDIFNAGDALVYFTILIFLTILLYLKDYLG